MSRAADRRAPHLRRGRRDARRRDRRARRPTGSHALDVAAIGANHGAGLLAALDGARADAAARAACSRRCRTSASRASRRPRCIYPHATPEYFAEFAAHARDLGARVIGGCCGTTPAEIAAIRAAIEEDRRARTRLEADERELAVALGEEQRETGSRARSARASSSFRCSSTRRSAARTRGLLEVAHELEESGLVHVRRRQRQRHRAGRHELADGRRSRSSARPGSRRSRT